MKKADLSTTLSQKRDGSGRDDGIGGRKKRALRSRGRWFKGSKSASQRVSKSAVLAQLLGCVFLFVEVGAWV